MIDNEYDLIISNSHEDFILQVNGYLQNGYCLLGSTIIKDYKVENFDYHDFVYFQAVRKEQK